MKKTFVKVIALALALVTLTCVFASCGTKLSGKYEATIDGAGAILEFKGSKVELSVKAFGKYGDPISGEYEIKDGKITLTFEEENVVTYLIGGTSDFEKAEDTIKIGIFTFTKTK